MTYCLGIKLNDGIVFAADSRTSAGVDNVSTYGKMYTFQPKPDRFFVLLTAGNLATTQSVVNLIQRDIAESNKSGNLGNSKYLFDAAQYVGEISRTVQKQTLLDDENGNRKSFEASFILGGQIGNQEHDILLVYPEGNYISASPVKPYLQIGETKYGKPILDRIIDPQTSLADAARCALVSLDSAMRSNVSVGPPLEILIYQKNTMAVAHQLSFDTESGYYNTLKDAWNDGLRGVFNGLPRFDWES